MMSSKSDALQCFKDFQCRFKKKNDCRSNYFTLATGVNTKHFMIASEKKVLNGNLPLLTLHSRTASRSA